MKTDGIHTIIQEHLKEKKLEPVKRILNKEGTTEILDLLHVQLPADFVKRESLSLPFYSLWSAQAD